MKSLITPTYYHKYLLLIIFIAVICIDSHAQKEGYEHYTNIPPPHYTNDAKARKFRLNGLLLSPLGEHLVLNYGRRASTLAIFTFPGFNLLGLHHIDKTVELSQSYFYRNDSVLFVKEDRYAPDYSAILIYKDRKLNIQEPGLKRELNHQTLKISFAPALKSD